MSRAITGKKTIKKIKQIKLRINMIKITSKNEI